MAVYVDNARNFYRGMKMCHMAADSVEELHEMADRIGIKRKWYQTEKYGHRYPHYDICKSKRELAIQMGAIPVDSREIIRRIEQCRTS